jgi:fumarate reductase flavoprotein subunit
MALAYNPLIYYGIKNTAAGDTGDGIRLGQGAGADLTGFGGAACGVRGLAGTTLSTTKTIWVNRYGQRFENETAQSIANSALQPWQVCGWVSESAGFPLYNQDQMKGWAIFDDAGKGTNTTTTPVVSASTIAGLAAAIGVNPDSLTATVNQWNKDQANSVDTLFGRPINFFPLTTPPYYAAPLTWSISGMGGGLKINTKTQVLDTSGNVIPHLYAAGASAGGIIGRIMQIQGVPLGAAYTMGRIAGTTASKETAWQ